MNSIIVFGELVAEEDTSAESSGGCELILSAKLFSAMTRGWQCCKCQETMYNDELNCGWCKHRRCSSCRSFIN